MKRSTELHDLRSTGSTSFHPRPAPSTRTRCPLIAHTCGLASIIESATIIDRSPIHGAWRERRRMRLPPCDSLAALARVLGQADRTGWIPSASRGLGRAYERPRIHPRRRQGGAGVAGGRYYAGDGFTGSTGSCSAFDSNPALCLPYTTDPTFSSTCGIGRPTRVGGRPRRLPSHSATEVSSFLTPHFRASSYHVAFFFCPRLLRYRGKSTVTLSLPFILASRWYAALLRPIFRSNRLFPKFSLLGSSASDEKHPDLSPT